MRESCVTSFVPRGYEHDLQTVSVDPAYFYWLRKQTEPPEDMWFSREPNLSGDCVRIVCAEHYWEMNKQQEDRDSECLLADRQCDTDHSVLCEKEASPDISSNNTYTHVSKLNSPESSWYRMTSSDARSRLECAAACRSQQASGSCGAFIYDSTLPTKPCIMYSTDSTYTEAITGERYAQLYITSPPWKC
ncbi:hypothetical protein RRG08_032943 [Elysia crispata]|uniref:Apple domain-containing protein n=1 Tax=Elysia crispata TaxID=231223 RepID=A0AAE1DBD8_9GAST|nr:hypothetical protein RRG08_032943 [Elysia crispata]